MAKIKLYTRSQTRKYRIRRQKAARRAQEIASGRDLVRITGREAAGWF